MITRLHFGQLAHIRSLATAAMGRRSGIDTSPPVHREMVKLDRDLFKRSIPVIAARVPAEKTKSVIASGVMKKLLASCWGLSNYRRSLLLLQPVPWLAFRV